VPVAAPHQFTAPAFADVFVPNGTFQLTGPLVITLTLNLLQAGQNGIPSPGNYDGYVINYTYTPIPEYAFLFVASDGGGAIQEGNNYQFGTDANYFTGALNLVEADIGQAGAGGGETPTGTPDGNETA
jgi:hypothetical protein